MCRLVGLWKGKLTLLEATASTLNTSSLREESSLLGARRRPGVDADAGVVFTLRRDVRSMILDVHAWAIHHHDE